MKANILYIESPGGVYFILFFRLDSAQVQETIHTMIKLPLKTT